LNPAGALPRGGFHVTPIQDFLPLHFMLMAEPATE